ncbi:hypothetical protein PORCAN_169 [Porphyromonas crevioricanis JCM 13913]|nr:hypothetical protein PORCAN_169 [Porphyromonas crevioricanis JCM 13913]
MAKSYTFAGVNGDLAFVLGFCLSLLSVGEDPLSFLSCGVMVTRQILAL